MKKIVVASICILFLFTNCQPTVNRSFQLLDYVPKDASLVLKINKLEVFLSNLKNNSFLKKIENTKIHEDLKEYSKQLEYINTSKPILVCITEVGIGNYEYAILSEDSNLSFKLDGISDKKIETLSYENVEIQKTTLHNSTSYTTLLDHLVINSSSQLLIENSIRSHKTKNFKTDDVLKKAFETSNDENIASVLIHNSNFFSLFKDLFPNNTSKNLKNISNWLSADINFEYDQIVFNGVALSKNNTSDILSILYENDPEVNKLAAITPINADGFISYTYTDWELLKKNIANYNGKTQNDTSKTTLFDTSNEIGIIYNESKECVAIHYVNIETALIELENTKTIVEEFRSIPIYKYNDFKILVDTFSPLISNSAANFYTVLDNFLIFSDQVASLHTIISNYQNKSTIENTSAYKETISSLNDASSLLMVSNNLKSKEFLAKNIKNSYQKDFKTLQLKEFPHFVVQFVSEGNFSHFNLAIKEIKKHPKSGIVSQSLSITLDAEIISQPQFVVNHRNKQKEIVVQDIENQLYLISNKGKVLWKKKLRGQILGTIEQVDLYKNGRLQLAFATNHEFHIIDRNGNEVTPFPLKFVKNITQPLAIFDYDKNKDYRFLMSFGKELKMYNATGNEVTGFTFSKNSDQIIMAPKHFRENGKDYIVIAQENGKLHILNRRGQTRVRVNEKINFSGNDIFIYKNKFSTTNTNGSLIQVDKKGAVSEQPLQLKDNHKIDATSKTLASISDNILSIKDKKIELDFGFYSSPKIFYINDKIYVTITDTQTNKVYLFDSNAISIPNFPVYGISAIDIGDLNNDGKLELVVQGEKKSLLVYTLN